VRRRERQAAKDREDCNFKIQHRQIRVSDPSENSAAEEIRPSRGSQNPTALDRHYETVRVGMAGILRELGVAA
jgi:hypothetical protein